VTRRGLFQLLGAIVANRQLPALKAAPIARAYRGGRYEWQLVSKLQMSSLYGKFGYDINSAYPHCMTHGSQPV
jgi:hypothetical protein